MAFTGFTYKQVFSGAQVFREAYVNLPPGLTKTTPVDALVAHHGGGGDYTFVESRGIRAAAESAGMLLIAARGEDLGGIQGESRTWRYGGDQATKINNNPGDDVEYIDMAIETVKSIYNVQRLFACGMSTGAIFSYRLVCESRFQWSGLIAHSGTRQKFDTIIPAGTCPLLHIHGADDTNVPWNGGATNPVWRSPQTGIAEWEAAGNAVTVELITGGGHGWYTLADTPPFDSTGRMMTWIGAL